MSKLSKFIRTFSISPKIALSKAVHVFINRIKNSKARSKAFSNATYSVHYSVQKQDLFHYFSLPTIDLLGQKKEIIKQLSANILEHRFNLLGSGWVEINNEKITLNPTLVKRENNVSHVLLVNKINVEESRKIFELISHNYKPLDWQLDFKSGYRWTETTWYKDIVFGNFPGADIKVPWELGRMQYLPILAFAASLAKNYSTEFNDFDLYKNEFRNQLLDFIAFNPPGFGVQWHSSMDVAIRAVNWLISYDLFKSAGCEFDEQFNFYFIRSIYEHGRHITHNLEWSSGMRGNHYLANIAGLLFISAYLPSSEEIDSWLLFSVCELIEEIFFQFLTDGGNFEASTNYHFLSTEIVLYSIALLLSLPGDKLKVLANNKNLNLKLSGKKTHPERLKEHLIIINNQIKFSNQLLERLNKIIEFSYALLNSNGEIPQIGDNDNGRFLKLTPNYIFDNNNKLHANLSNHFNILSIFAAIAGTEKLTKVSEQQFEFYILRDSIKNKIDFTPLTIIQNLNPSSKAFNNFGLYTLKNENYELFIRCGSLGQMGKGGHSHNDQLSTVLNVRDMNFIVDPGTFVYTEYPSERNKFRSVSMHNTLWFPNTEQNPWQEDSIDDLFWFIKEKTKSKVLFFDLNRFSGEHYAYDKPHKREIGIDSNKIKCSDTCNVDEQKFVSFHLAPLIEIINIEHNAVNLKLNNFEIILSTDSGEIESYDYEYSPEYGIKQVSKEIRIKSRLNRINWEIEIK